MWARHLRLVAAVAMGVLAAFCLLVCGLAPTPLPEPPQEAPLRQGAGPSFVALPPAPVATGSQCLQNADPATGAPWVSIAGGSLLGDAGIVVVIDGGEFTVLQGTTPWTVGGTVTVDGGELTVLQGTTPWTIAGNVSVDGGVFLACPQDGGPCVPTGFSSNTALAVQSPSGFGLCLDSTAEEIAAATQTVGGDIPNSVMMMGAYSPATGSVGVVNESAVGDLIVDQGRASDAGAWPVLVSGSVVVVVDGGELTVLQGTSPWVTSGTVAIDGGTLTVLQGTTPWTVAGNVNVNVDGGTVTANQGTANTVANAWPEKVTDGTNTAAVAAANTTPDAGAPALVVSLSPNSNGVTAATQPDITTPGLSITTLGGAVAAVTAQTAAISFGIEGTWTGTISFQASVDGTNYFPIRGRFLGGSGATSDTTSTTVNGILTLPTASLADARILSTGGSFTGTATVTVIASVGSAASRMKQPSTMSTTRTIGGRADHSERTNFGSPRRVARKNLNDAVPRRSAPHLVAPAAVSFAPKERPRERTNAGGARVTSQTPLAGAQVCVERSRGGARARR